MAKIKQKISITEVEDSKIRREWVPSRQCWDYSITDIIAVLTDSVDSRNYWKALKNRLKTNHNQLVTDCNQLKMRANDGKLYMVDTADADTILKIIQIIAPYNIPPFKSWFEHIEVKNSFKKDSINNNAVDFTKTNFEDLKLSPTLEPAIDIYEDSNNIIVQIMLAGVSPDKIIITVNMHTLIIKGQRLQQKNNSSDFKEFDNYLLEELQWGDFYREINFDTLIDTDKTEATEFKGLINIKLYKIDQDKNRFIKIKSI